MDFVAQISLNWRKIRQLISSLQYIFSSLPYIKKIWRSISHVKAVFTNLIFACLFLYQQSFKFCFLSVKYVCILLKAPSETLRNSSCCVWLNSNKRNAVFTFFVRPLWKDKNILKLSNKIKKSKKNKNKKNYDKQNKTGNCLSG